METQVLIIGAGPTGLTLAIDLGLRGVRCTLVEQKCAPQFLRAAGALPDGRLHRALAPRAAALSPRVSLGRAVPRADRRLRGRKPGARAAGVTARTVEGKIRCAYMVGCDGGSSTVRRQLLRFSEVLLRPDLHVAWRGNRPPEDPARLAAVATGHGAGP